MDMEGDLQYLWKPKKTLRDWGKTEYKIIRNWTPHGLKSTNNSSQGSNSGVPLSQHKHTSTSSQSDVIQSPPEATRQNYRQSIRQAHRKNTATDSIPLATRISSANEQGLPHLEEHGIESHIQEDQEEVVESVTTSHLPSLSPSVREHIRTSLLSLQRLRSSKRNRNHDDNSHETTLNRSSSEDIHGEFEDDMDCEIITESETEEGGVVSNERTLLDVCNEHANVVVDMSSSGDEGVKTRSGRKRVKDTAGVERVKTRSAGIERVKTKSSGIERVNQSEDEEVQIQIKKKRSSTKTKRGRKHTETDSHAVKLWQPKHINRSKSELNELDICLTTYDRIIRDKIFDSGDDATLQQALVNHWKCTRRSAMHMIRDVHTVQALDKRYKQEKRKQAKLQKEMSGVLSSLRKSNKKYHTSVLKTKEVKRQKEVESLQNEIEVLTQQLQPIFSHST